MDWIQWYYLGLIIIGFLAAAFCVATETDIKGTDYKMIPVNWCFRMTIALPIVGRMFNWW